jgi:hypothetical protein
MLKALPKLQSILCGLRRPTDGVVATDFFTSLWMSLHAIGRKNDQPVRLSTAISLIQT